MKMRAEELTLRMRRDLSISEYILVFGRDVSDEVFC